MNIYTYMKMTEPFKQFEPVLKVLKDNNPNAEIYAVAEGRRIFDKLRETVQSMQQNDILVVSDLPSVGISNTDIVNFLDGMAANRHLLVILSRPSTYEYGVVQPTNMAVLATIKQGILDADSRIKVISTSRRRNSGRHPAAFPDGWEEMYDAWKDSKITSKEFLAKSGLKKATFYNLISLYEDEMKQANKFIKKYKTV